MTSLLEFFCLGLFLQFASSNFEYDYSDSDPNSNYNSNVANEDCNGPKSNQLSEKECFCYAEPENDIDYSICKDSGAVMYF